MLVKSPRFTARGRFYAGYRHRGGSGAYTPDEHHAVRRRHHGPDPRRLRNDFAYDICAGRVLHPDAPGDAHRSNVRTSI